MAIARTLSAVLLGAAVLSTAPALAEDAPTSSRTAAFDKLPYWPGYWVPVDRVGTAISGMGRDYEAVPEDAAGLKSDSLGLWAPGIPWNEEGKRRVEESAKTMNARKGLGWSFPTMMTAATPWQILITPEEVLIINAYNETRHIYTDGRDHPPAEDLWPTTTGNSIGHWEGDTLVVDTIMVTNPNEYFQAAPPLSEEAHYVERFWYDGEHLRGTMTVTDPVTLAKPWVSNLIWTRETGFDRMIQVDWSNDRTGNDGEVNTIEPTED